MRKLLAAACLALAGTAAAQEPTPEPAEPSAAISVPDVAATPGPEARATPAPAPPAPRTIGTGGASLADIARRQKEQREREGKKPSLGVISNQTLRKGGPAGEEKAAKGGAKAKASPTPAPRGTAAAAPVPAIPEWRDLKGRTEADWRRLMSGVRDRVSAAESRVKTLEADARRYENDFYAWSDGNYRDRVIRPAWDQARTELANARKELEAARSQLGDLEEEARKSSAPPGWLR